MGDLGNLNGILGLNEQIDLGLFVLKLFLIVLFTAIMSFTYRRYNFGSEFKYSNFITFPMLGLSIVMIITVIKTSIALSLGLVGALSIVRFRTPIKNSEELIYYFLIIALAIALGAGRIFESIYFFIFSTITVALLHSFFVRGTKKSFLSNVVSIECENENYLKVQELMEIQFSNLKFIALSSYENLTFLKYSVTEYNEEKIQKLLDLQKSKVIKKVIVNNIDDLPN